MKTKEKSIMNLKTSLEQLNKCEKKESGTAHTFFFYQKVNV